MQGLSMGIGGRLTFTRLRSLLFGSGQQGGIYLPYNPSTGQLAAQFQDSAGATPVTAVQDPVGLMKDVRFGLATAGNDTLQATSAARPPLSARVNQLLATATLATQSVTVLATSQVLSFTGTGTVTLSGVSTAGPLVGTGANDRVSLTFTPTAGSLTLTVTGSVTLADLRTADDAAKSIPAYQRVTTATDYDTEGFTFYETYDGIDNHRTCATGGGATAGFFWCGVLTVTGGAGTDRLLLDDRSGTNAGRYINISSSNNLQFAIGNGSFLVAASTASNSLVVGTTYVLAVWFDGTTLFAQINNATPVSVAMSGSPSAGAAGFTEGKANLAAALYLNARLYGRVFAHYCPSQAQREAVKRYLAREAGCLHLVQS